MLNRVILILIGVLIVISVIYALRDTRDFTTNSSQAYAEFMKARDLGSKLYAREAMQKMKEALGYDSNFAMAWAGLANFEWQSGRRDEAYKDLDRAFKQYDKLKKHEKLLLDIQKLSYADSQPELVAKLQQFVEAFPNRIEGHEGLGGLAWERGDIDAAIKENQKILEIDPQYSLAYNALGYLYFGKGDFVQSLKYFDKYIEILPNQANPHDSKGEILMAIGKYDQALEEFKIAQQIEPSFVFVLYHVADAYARKGIYSKTDQIYGKIQDIISEGSEKRTLEKAKAMSLIERGELVKAHQFCDDLIKEGLAGNDSLRMFLGHLGHALAYSAFETGDTTQAIFQLNQATAIYSATSPPVKDNSMDDRFFQLEYTAGWVNYRRGDNEKVLSLEALIADKRLWRPDSKIAFKDLLARAYFKLGQKEKAFALEDSNLQINPNWVGVLITLAAFYEEDGKPTLAAEQLRRVLEIYKDADQGVPKIEKIKSWLTDLTSIIAS